ncbi:MAG: hypothetical protein IH623_09835 [Verrucomicrobia bacterium]|nr:hypothetical protein [Verrucomicrobiota bacterium]
MMTTESSTILDAEEFIAESGLLKKWAVEAFDCDIRSALRQAGFECRRLRRVREHRLIIVDGDCDRIMEFRPPRVIKTSVLRSFRERGLSVRPEFYSLRGAGARLTVSVGVFEKA